ncbi:hypothetical protein HHI36_017535, partial [Cryptolaemus montrouzieri]
MPDSCILGIICLIDKKGDKSDLKNYRGITLLETAYKILTTILNDRMKKTDYKIGEYQCRLRATKRHHRQIME